MSVVELVRRMGGLATRADCLRNAPRAEVDSALRSGELVTVGHGRYALESVDEATAIAHGLSGVLSLTSAALWHGWEVKTVPVRPHVTLPRKRRVAPAKRSGIELHRADLCADEIAGGIATSKEATLLQCLRQLPFDEALCVADSALRHDLDPAMLRRIARSATGPGSRQVRRVAQEARGEAANAFESVLRGIALDVPGLSVDPQKSIRSSRLMARPDLVDADLGVVLEADSFEWHGDRAALRKDARRYNLLVVDGWLVLRFAWEDVMFDPDYVREVLIAVVALVGRRTNQVACPRCAA